MIWKKKKLGSMGDVMEAAMDIFKRNDVIERTLFVEVYRRVTPHADANLGYGAGYYDNETRLAFQKFFGVTHPYFGDKAVTTDEAFELGKQLGEKIRSEVS